MNKISACMIVKNEESCLEGCLKSLKGHVDEIVVVDTGSTDSTKNIAAEYADKVENFKWVDDFSAARNYSAECASNDWVFVMDADDLVKVWDDDSVRNYIDSTGEDSVGCVECLSIHGDGQKRTSEPIVRLYNRRYFHFCGTIHEQVTALNGKDFRRKDLPLTLLHSGYTDDEVKRKNKAARNIMMLEAEITRKGPDGYLLFQLGRSHVMNKDLVKARGCFEQAIRLVDNFNYAYARDLIIAYGYTLVDSQDYAGALEIEKYKDFYLASPDYNFLLAYVYMVNTRFDEAIKTFLKCTQMKNGQTEGVTSFLPLYNAGVICECLGRSKDALGYYKLCGDYTPAVARIKML